MNTDGIKIAEGVTLLRGLPAVYYKKDNAIIVADLHLGYEEAMSLRGVFLPRLQFRKIREVLLRAKNTTNALKLIVNGDIKHEFARLLRAEKLETARFIREAFRIGFKEIIVVRGNHDNYIGPILKDLGAEFVEEVDYGDLLVVHGHRKIDPRKYETIIIGHEHPAVQVSVGGAKAKFPALLRVPLKSGGEAIVLPAAGTYQVGNNITLDSRLYLSPLIREYGVLEDIIPVIVVEEERELMVLPRLGLLSSII